MTNGKTFVGKILQTLGHLPAELLNLIKSLGRHAEIEIDMLPPDDKIGLINGTKLAEILKTNIGRSEDEVLAFTATNLNVSRDIAKGAILGIGRAFGIDTGNVKDVQDKITIEAQNAVTDDSWNALWRNIASFGVTWLTQGKLDWVSLSLGLLEAAYQKYVK